MTYVRRVCFLVIIFAGSLVFAQAQRGINEDGSFQGVVRIKFKPQMTGQLDAVLLQKADPLGNIPLQENGAYAVFGIAEVDLLNRQFKIQSIQRVFRPAGKHEAKHREFGLHLWYELTFDERQPLPEVVAAYHNAAVLDISEPVFSVKLYNNDEKTASGNLMNPPNDPGYRQQWHYQSIKCEAAWREQSGNPSVVVAVIDQGVDCRHPDIAGNMWKNAAEIPGNGRDDDQNGYVDDIYGYDFGNNTGNIKGGKHGTHVAGTVAAVSNNNTGVAGVAGGSGRDDGIRIMSCSALSGNARNSLENALAYAADNGAAIAQNSWGVNTRLGYRGPIKSWENAIDYFVANANRHPGAALKGGKGLAIFAAGNDNVNDPMMGYPGSYRSVIAVAATDRNNRKSSFSNYGSWVDISAPGSNIYSLQPGNGYGSMSGTSMACPHVSGVAALIASKYFGAVTADQIRTALLKSVTPLRIAGMGSGLLNAEAALKFLGNVGTNQPPTVTIRRPRNGEQFKAGENITLNAEARDADGSVVRVAYFQGSRSLGTASVSPYEVVWQNVPAGEYSLTAVAMDDKGATQSSAAVSVTVESLTPIKNPQNPLANVYALQQNYPNPFNPSTEIHYSLAERAAVSIKVYDLEGRNVATLLNQVQTAGEYQLTFDASELSAGIYFYRLMAGKFSQMKKMILLK